MAKTISSATLYRYNIGPYTNEKAGGYYDMYSEALANNIASFISQLNSYAAKPEANHQPNKQRGKIVV